MFSTRSRATAVAFLVIAVLAVAGCGESAVTGSTSTSSPTSSDTSSDNATTSAIVVIRTGGIAGVSDMVRIAADGTATLTSRTSESRACTPSAAALDRLRAIDIAAVGAASKPPQIADAFNYSVRSGDARATVSEGDADSRRAELVDAAAAVVASCLAMQS